MSNYVFNTSLSYANYLQAQSFVDDVTSGQESIACEVSTQTREIVASLDELSRDHINAIEGLRDELADGMERLAIGVDAVAEGIDELNARFHWGFSELIAGVGHVNDSLQTLISLAKTPTQTWAYNQYEIARDAIRRRLWPEALQALDRAINGFGDQPGYPLEFRFHHHKGMIYLGNFRNADPTVIDLAKAEDAFVAAGRYAEADYPREAGRVYLAAGWSAYCYGNTEAALRYTIRAADLHPLWGEAFFQLGKIRMHAGDPEAALPQLQRAIELDRLYALRAPADGDFQRFEARVRQFLEDLRRQAQQEADKAIDRAAAAMRWRRGGLLVGGDERDHQGVRQALSHLEESRVARVSGTLFGYQDAKEAALAALRIAERFVDEMPPNDASRQFGKLRVRLAYAMEEPIVSDCHRAALARAEELFRGWSREQCLIAQNDSSGQLQLLAAALTDVEKARADAFRIASQYQAELEARMSASAGDAGRRPPDPAPHGFNSNTRRPRVLASWLRRAYQIFRKISLRNRTP